ncbi:MAG: sigma-70 family RNA polymerase sigma factor [Oscillospiraceae bacterium]|nr:sigma-70 family RNA polymerase sigma factor [Oscillospiraceae bacterium]
MEHDNEHVIPGEELYNRYITGNNEAFEKIVEMYKDELYYFIYGMVHDYHESKQLMIEAFAQLAVSNKFARKSSLKTYLFAIAKNLAIRYVKMRKNKEYIPYEEITDVLMDEGDTVESLIEREDDRRYVQEAMRSLKEEYYTVLHLLYFEDMSYIQAGKAMNRSVKQITDLAYRAKLALKKKLESDGFTYD